METECLDFRSLPDQNPLFLSYLYEFERVQEFYSALPRTDEQWRARVSQVLEQPHFPRRDLVEILERFNRRLGGGDEGRANLHTLLQPDTVAVVTGQQVGLLGGPGYSIYKAATALRLVQRLRQLGFRAVPVFWLAADDSDFEEVRSAWFAVPGQGVVSIRHPDTRIGDHEAAGAIPLTNGADWWQELRGLLNRSIASEAWQDALLEDYVPGSTFREAFARWIHRIFAGHGLIFFDPLLDGYREGLREFFQLAVHRRADLVEALRRRDRQLHDSGFTPQVRVDDSETCLFLWEGLERTKLEFSDGAYRIKGRKGSRYSPGELAAAIGTGAIQVTPNVLLRPLVQDYLFPTAGGVTGPAEIAYFAQVNAIAGWWGQQPVVYPRAAFTIVDRKSRRLLRQYGLEVGEILREPAANLVESMVRAADRQEILQQLDQLREDVSQRLSGLVESINQFDPTVAAKARRTAERMSGGLGRLQRRFVDNTVRRDEVLRRHVEHLVARLKPHGHLQERVLNFAGILAEGGPGFLDMLLSRVEPDRIGHRVVFL